MDIREELLHHIWKYRLFRLPLLDMDDLPVELVDPGQHTRDSGPDFFNARVRSEGLLWAGNVEIHKKASEWYQHGHHLDPAFDNVILHVVIDPDCQVRNSRGREIRTVRMEIPPETRRRYELLMNNPELVPCWRNLPLVDLERMNLWLEKLLIERFEERVARIRGDLASCAGDWQEVFYRSLARAMGQHVNADPFEMLARSVPRETIRKHCPDLISKEAILFGQAGMLGEKENLPGGNNLESTSDLDLYFSELCGRYNFLQNKLGLQPISGFLWKFLRLRPDNFPTIRISQLASSLEKYPDLYRQLQDHPDPLEGILKLELKASEYWNTHYRFRRESPPREKSPGKDRMTGLFINAVLPVLFAQNLIRGNPSRVQELTEMLVRIPPENNRIIRMWKSLGMAVPDGFSSQALLHLTNNYCIFKRCLSCYAGSQITQSYPPQK
jgi:hypothetical protein